MASTTQQQTPTFSAEQAAQLAALLAEQAAEDQYAREQARLAQKAAMAPLASVLTEDGVNALLTGLQTVRPALTGEEFNMASNLITVLEHGGLGLARAMKALDTPTPTPPALTGTA